MEKIPTSINDQNLDRKRSKFSVSKSERAKLRERALYAHLGAVALTAVLLAVSSPEHSAARDVPVIEIDDTSGDESSSSLHSNNPPTAGAETIINQVTRPSLSLPSAGVDATIHQNTKPTTSLPTADNEVIINPRKTEELSRESWDGPILNAYDGHIDGPTGDETYYNLPMDDIVARMHRMGVDGEYWEREDGVKMLGDYVMVAANLEVHPRGSIIETSLGTGIVCDTGSFAKKYPKRLDIATNWDDPRESSR